MKFKNTSSLRKKQLNLNSNIKSCKKVKILCISDHIDPIVYSNAIKKRFKDIDFVISSGDLPLNYYDYIVSNLNKPLFFVFGNHNLKRIGNYKKAYKYKQKIERIRGITRFYSIPGYIESIGVGATYVGGKVVRRKGLLIAGLGGSMWYNGKPNQYTEFNMRLYLLKLIPGLLWNKIFYGRYLDILVTHAPPFGIHDCPDICHRGFKAFIWFLKKFRPKLHIHGHIHLYNRNTKRETQFVDTRVINAYDHHVVQLELTNLPGK